MSANDREIQRLQNEDGAGPCNEVVARLQDSDLAARLRTVEAERDAARSMREDWLREMGRAESAEARVEAATSRLNAMGCPGGLEEALSAYVVSHGDLDDRVEALEAALQAVVRFPVGYAEGCTFESAQNAARAALAVSGNQPQ